METGATLVWQDKAWGRAVFWEGRTVFREYAMDLLATGAIVMREVDVWTVMNPPEDRADAMEVARQRYARLLAEAS